MWIHRLILENPIVQKILKDNEVGDDKETIEKFFKFQGMQNLTDFLEKNDDLTQFIYDEIKEMVIG